MAGERIDRVQHLGVQSGRGRDVCPGGAGVVAVMLALAGPLEKAKGGFDPDCTAAKAARGATTKAMVGVRGNRCSVGETTRDTLGIDDRDRNNEDDDGPLKKRRDND
jgi:hypothetical protein